METTPITTQVKTDDLIIDERYMEEMKTKINSSDDDGSLAFLQLPKDKNSKSFNCPSTSQGQLVNSSFWVCDFVEDVRTKFSDGTKGNGKTLILIKDNPEDPESKARKFFTGSKEILYTLRMIKELEAFPRKVTLRVNGSRYFLE